MTEITISAKPNRIPATSEGARAFPTVSTVLAVGGLLLLLWVAWVMFFPGPPPYRYQLVEQGDIERFPELELSPNPDIVISKYQLRLDDTEKPLAIVYVGANVGNGRGPVLLDWQNQIDEPLITVTPPITEFSGLVTVMNKHLSEDALVLGWWDTALRLELLAGVDTPFDENLAKPLIIPEVWHDQRQSIEEIERRFWGVGENAEQVRFQFDGFQEALLADKASGAARLEKLARGREIYLVLHISDAYKLGMANPGRFGIGYRDFPSSGNIHTISGHVKTWLKENGYESFTLEKRGPTSTRVYFLTDTASADTLIAQALPFTTSQPFDLPGLSVVYQSGGYWVYKLSNSET